MAGIRTYLEETINELTNKVSWPSWEDLQASSIIVLTTSAILSLIIWLMDYVFGINALALNDSGEVEGWWRGILGFIYELIKFFK